MFFHRSILQPVKEGCTFYDFCFKIIKNMREKQIQITARVLILLLSVLNVSYNVLVCNTLKINKLHGAATTAAKHGGNGAKKHARKLLPTSLPTCKFVKNTPVFLPF